jgi:UDPglucose 6-dehydrogenase
LRIAVYGLWHLGSVTAACLAAANHVVVGLDLDERVVTDLQQGNPPLYEPGLSALIESGLKEKRLSFTNQPLGALHDAQVLWVTFDTPVNDRDEADVEFVRTQLDRIAPVLQPGTLVLISSQVPVGFTRALALDWQTLALHYAYTPENLRLGKALESFQHPQRVIIGLQNRLDQSILTELFAPICRRIEWMSIESAEMTKHALNAFLATSISFINELARLCEVVGADAKEVERGLKSEERIGPRAYLSPGAAFAGGTLARDVRFLVSFGQHCNVETPLFSGVLASNNVHKGWLQNKVAQFVRTAGQPIVAVLGLTYKPGTDTLRRSESVALCQWLYRQGVRVQAHDPAISALPDELRPVMELCTDPHAALMGADLVVIATEWPDYRQLRAEDFIRTMRQPRIIDQNSFLSTSLAGDQRIIYVATGNGSEN